MFQKLTTEKFHRTITLSSDSIVALGDDVDALLSRMKLDHQNHLRFCLFLEEILLRLQSYLGSEAAVEIDLASHRGRTYVSLSFPGDPYNPLYGFDDPLEEWTSQILSNIGLRSEYSYRSRCNQIRIYLRKEERKPAVSLLISILLAFLVGIIGNYVLPEQVWSTVLTTVFEPIYDLYLRLLNTVAGPAVFLSVLVAVYGIGNVSVHGATGKLLVRRLLIGAFSVTAIASLLALLFYLPSFSMDSAGIHSFSSILRVIVDFVPKDIISPFTTGNSPALFFLALVIANALLLAGKQADALVHFSVQANNLIQITMEWIAKLIPYFIFVILIFQDPLLIFHQLLPPIALFILVAVFLTVCKCIAVRLRCKISLSELFDVLRPTFTTAFIHASSTSALLEINYCCREKFGISKNTAEYSIPLGLVLYMPMSGISFLMISFQMARYFNVSIGPVWLITAVVMTAALAIASPPIPSVNLMAYTVVFAQLGIPAEGLVFALVADSIFSFFFAALNAVFLEIELLLHAHSLNLRSTQKSADTP